METGKFFARMYHFDGQPPMDLDAELNKRYWLKVNNTVNFVITKFDETSSDDITHGLTQPDKFYFSDNGNIKCKKVDGKWMTIKNPIDTNRTTGFGQSIKKLAADEKKQYVFDDKNIISKNLKYILRKEGQLWHLLHNPIHSSGFRDYYKVVMRDANNINFGVTTEETDQFLNLQKILHNYCEGFKVKNGTSWLDPTCNIFYSDDICRRSALFGENKVEYEPNLVRAAKGTLEKMSMGDDGTSPLCTCWGNPFNYMTQNVAKDSFVHVFQRGAKTCPKNIKFETNSLILEAEKIKIENSNLDVGGTPPPTTPTTTPATSTTTPATPTTTPATPTTTPATPTTTPEDVDDFGFGASDQDNDVDTNDVDTNDVNTNESSKNLSQMWNGLPKEQQQIAMGVGGIILLVIILQVFGGKKKKKARK